MPQLSEIAIAATPTTSDRQPNSPKTDPLTRKCRYIIAAVLTWDTQQEVSSDEIEAIAVQHDTLWIRLTGDRAVSLHTNTFRSIRRQQMEEQARVEAEMDMTLVLRESDIPLADTFGHYHQDDIEIDSEDSPNPTYRVWQSFNLLGTFHRSPVDGKWITHPVFGRDYNLDILSAL